MCWVLPKQVVDWVVPGGAEPMSTSNILAEMTPHVTTSVLWEGEYLQQQLSFVFVFVWLFFSI